MSDTLTRPGGTALFVEQDARPVAVVRQIVHHCTRAAWDDPLRRAQALAEGWALTLATIRSEDETFLSHYPVTLYREPLTGRVMLADISRPGRERWILPDGRALLCRPPLFGLIFERTTYANWCEGPLSYTGDHEPLDAPDPFADRQLQEVRHQNAALREKIDAAILPSLDPIAQEIGRDDLVDFRFRGIFLRAAPRVFTSRQTGDAAHVLIDGHAVGIDEVDQSILVREA